MQISKGCIAWAWRDVVSLIRSLTGGFYHTLGQARGSRDNGQVGGASVPPSNELSEGQAMSATHSVCSLLCVLCALN